MSEKPLGSWDSSTGLARAILHDRKERRKWLAYMTLVPLGMIGIGLWGISEWIVGNPWRMLLWWGGCALATLVVILFALYDVLAVIREERKNRER